MSRLDHRRVFVAGGTGDVGEGIVKTLLERGAEVIVPVRARGKGDRLRASAGRSDRLVLLDGRVGEFDGADALAAEVGAGGELDGVVASLGGWWHGSKLADVDPEHWDRILADNLTSHQAVVRSFVPLLRHRQGAYIQILGAAAEFPVPHSSLISITAAAVAMLGRALDAESGRSVRVRQIMIAAMVATRSRAPGAATGVSVEEVGRLAADLIADTGGAAPLMTRIPRA